MIDNTSGYEISISANESKTKKEKVKFCEEKENLLPVSLPSASSPSTSKRNVTFNIYEELHGEDGNELKLIEDKGNKFSCEIMHLNCSIDAYDFFNQMVKS